MKNKDLAASAKYGTPMQKNYGAGPKMYNSPADMHGPHKMGHSPVKTNVPTEREANMSEERRLNEKGSKLNPKDLLQNEIRKDAFNKADELSDERARRNKAGNPMKMKDFSGDGEITQKDVLMGRGVIPKPGDKKS